MTTENTPETKPIPRYYQDADVLRDSANQAKSVLLLMSQLFETNSCDVLNEPDAGFIFNLLMDLMVKIEDTSYSLNDAAHRLVECGQVSLDQII